MNGKKQTSYHYLNTPVIYEIILIQTKGGIAQYPAPIYARKMFIHAEPASRMRITLSVRRKVVSHACVFHSMQTKDDWEENGATIIRDCTSPITSCQLNLYPRGGRNLTRMLMCFFITTFSRSKRLRLAALVETVAY